MYYFTCSDPEYVVYMGKNKYDNEDLIRYAWPGRDFWFHVDSLSSAHVYLRVPVGHSGDMKDIPDQLMEEASQLVKEHSIKGKKLDRTTICYTPVENLKKTKSMEVGQVGFRNDKLRLLRKIERNKIMVKRLLKTKVEAFPDLEGELRDFMGEEKAKKIVKTNELKRKEKADRRRQKELAELQSFKSLFEEGVVESPYADMEESDEEERARRAIDDFM